MSIKLNAYSLVSLGSGMDIFPTLLSLANITAPADRRYDGFDATNILLHGEKTGRKVVSQQIHFPTVFWILEALWLLYITVRVVFSYYFTQTAVQLESLVTCRQFDWGNIKRSTSQVSS